MKRLLELIKYNDDNNNINNNKTEKKLTELSNITGNIYSDLKYLIHEFAQQLNFYDKI